MNVSLTLRVAAQRVRQGWCQHAGFDQHGNVCAVGALCYSCERVEATSYGPVSTVLRHALDIESIADWNDTPGRTQEEVAQGLERAADYWESQQTPAIVWTMREDVTA